MKSTELRTNLLVVFTLLFFACPAQAVIVDRIVAVVNDTPITQSELNSSFEPIRKRIAAQPSGEERESTLKKAQEGMLNRMIDDILIEQEATRLGIKIPDEDVTGAIETILAQKNLTMNDFEKILEKESMSLEGYKKEVKTQMIRSKVVRRELRTAIAVTDEEIGEYYIKHRAEYEGQQAVRIKQIVLFFPEKLGDDIKQKMKGDMEAILKRLKAGETFDKLASQFSQGPTAKQGGDIGFVERGIMPPDMEQIAFTLEPGQISNVIESPAGFTIITVTDKRGEGTRMIESVRDEIKDKLLDAKMDKKIEEWMSGLRKKAHISIKE